MKENICTIPINDLFKESCGCPLCRLEKMLEDQHVEFITGDAMMTPDVRVTTNELGFCNHHSKQMLEKGPKLANALLMQTHLSEIEENLLPKNMDSFPSKKQIEKIDTLKKTCYVCKRIENDINHFIEIILSQYEIDEDFRNLYKSQEYLCLNHYNLLVKESQKQRKPKKYRDDFIKATNKLTIEYINNLYRDVTKFTTMYDYRNKGKDFSDCIDSVEKTIEFLK